MCSLLVAHACMCVCLCAVLLDCWCQYLLLWHAFSSFRCKPQKYVLAARAHSTHDYSSILFGTQLILKHFNELFGGVHICVRVHARVCVDANFRVISHTIGWILKICWRLTSNFHIYQRSHTSLPVSWETKTMQNLFTQTHMYVCMHAYSYNGRGTWYAYIHLTNDIKLYIHISGYQRHL